ncbi:MAG: hypothetical protein U0794_12300 [Isosphaeraceae bacterium]
MTARSQSTPSSRAVLKLGGSLLDWEGFPRALADFLDEAAVEQPVLIVGGGQIVEELRRLDAIHRLGELRGHELALDLLETTARLVASVVPEACIVRHVSGLEPAWMERKLPILSAREFLSEFPEIGGERLASTWATTSDSIAAWLARYLGCRVVLLKSTAPDAPIDRQSAMRIGLVDASFAVASRGVSNVALVNLRANPRVAIPLL